MKLLVLGRNGQLGSELVRQATAAGLVVLAPGHQDLDVSKFDDIRAAITGGRPDVLINASAYHVVSQCETDPAMAFRVNAAAIKVMAEECHRAGTRFFTFSTDYVFDGQKGTPYAEDDVPRPLQAYGVSKFAGEMMARLYNPAAVVIRTAGVFGGRSGSPMKGGNFVLTMLREAERNRQMEVSSEQVMSPTYAVDLAAATLALVNTGTPDPIYHLTNDGQCSWAEFAMAILKAAGKDMVIVPVDRSGTSYAAGRPPFAVLQNTRARALGITLPGWRDAVERYVRWLGDVPA